ncbi:DUF6879 family protein [Streptomyces sp. NPDC050759]|uniref:DUF6879 family protein n=1 Tax=Streptomyces sp. NPDC050759 TaxID=3365635 RepID=UPI0037A8EDB4
MERSAAHLETRDVYAISIENEGFAEWKQGHRLNPDDRVVAALARPRPRGHCQRRCSVCRAFAALKDRRS